MSPVEKSAAALLRRGLSPHLQQIAVVRQIELDVDDGPSFGIDRVFVRLLLGRRPKRAVAVGGTFKETNLGSKSPGANVHIVGLELNALDRL
jgi:hypothetical protein